MTAIKKFVCLFIFLDLPIIFCSFITVWNRGEAILLYPMSVVIQPFYDGYWVCYAFYCSLIMLFTLIITYNINNKKICELLFSICIIVFVGVCFVVISEISFYNVAKANYNPDTVQSTMIEIDLQHFKSMQANNENAMIYVGRPSCPHCAEIKPNLDILVNNSHSLVYYYNTEQDRDNNYDEMQAVLDAYGVGTVPALVVLQEAGETKEVYFDEDIIDYFLDTSRFKY